MKFKKFSKKFCPKCGKIIEGNSELCSTCNNIDFEFKDIVITICNSCKSYYYANKWASFKDLNAVVKKVLSLKIKINNTSNKVNNAYNKNKKFIVKKMFKKDLENILFLKPGNNLEQKITLKFNNQLFDIPVVFKSTLCNKCSRKNSKYFESILQLRNCNEEILSFIRREVLKQNKKGIYITKEVPLEKYSLEQIDIYLTNQTYAKTLAEKVRKNFGGIIKKNAQHYSLDWQTSKTVYRLNLLLELPNYKKNDVIKMNNHLYKIQSIGSKIHVVDLKTNTKTSLPNNNAYDILHPVIFQVIKRYPEYEVLDPNTYYQARLMNPSKKLEINQKIKVVIDGSEAWMI